MSRTSAGIQYNARSMNGIISINADEITCSGTITSDLIKASNLLEADTAETISGLWNFTTLPYSSVSAINGTDFTNLNSVNSAISSSLTGYVNLSGVQTITGAKTFNANLRLNNTRQLIFGTTYPTAGGVITYTTPNLYYDITGGGHYFFIGGSPNLYIDTDGLNIENGKYLLFNGKRCSMIDNGTQLVYNVPTGNSHSFRTNNVQRMTISADANGTLLTFPAGTIMREYTSFNWFLYQLPAGHTLKYQVGGTDILEVSTGGLITYEKVSLRNGKKLTWDEGFTNEAYLRKDTIANTLEYEVATGYKHKFTINAVQQLLLDATNGATFAGYINMKAGQRLVVDDTFLGGGISSGGSGGIRFDADTGGDFRFICDSTLGLTIQGTTTILPSNNILQLGITGSSIGYSAGANKIQYKVPTGKTHDFLVNNVSAVIIDASGVVIQSTAVGAGFPTQNLYLSQNKLSYIGSSTTDIRYNCPTGGSHNFYQNTSTYLGFWNSTSLTLSPNNVSLQMGTSSPAQIKHDTATSQLQYRTLGSFNHMFYIDGSLFYEMRTDTFRALRGYANKEGALGAYVANNFNFSWDTPSAGNLSVWIDTTRLGNMSIVSDYRLKENIVPARPVLDRLCKIKMIEYEFKNVSIFRKNGISHGFIAHEVAELFPELINIIHGEKDALTDDGLIQPQTIGGEITNLYLSGIQELNAKIEAQQKIIEDQQKQIDQLIVLFSQSRV